MFNAEVIGGTSVSAPAFAGMMALVAQSAKSRLGQANFVLYPLAASQNLTSCDASGPPQSSCVFNDLTQGNNSVPGQPGAAAGQGYDLATGLGSINAANLVANWGEVALRGTTTTLTLSPASITHGQNVAATVNVVSATGVGTPTGVVALLTGNHGDLNLGALTNGQIASFVTSLPGGVYTVNASYSGDGVFAPSTSNGATITVNPEPSRLAFSASSASVAYSDFVNLQATVVGVSKQGTATGTVSVSDTFKGNTTTLMTVPLNSLGNFTVGNSSLPLGTHQLAATYSGDPSFTASSAGPVSVTVSKGPTTTILFTPTGVPPIAAVVLQAIVIPNRGVAFPTGKVQFFDGTTALGGPVKLDNEIATSTTTQLTNGANTITATYAGDSNFNPSTSSPASVFVGNPDFQIAVNPGTVTVSSSSPGTAKILVSPGPGLGVTGTVSFSCSGQPSGILCSFQPATLDLDGYNPQTTFLTISKGSEPSGGSGASMRGDWARAVGLGCVFLFGLTGRRRSRWRTMLVSLMVLGVAGCGSSLSSSTTTNPTANSYALVVTAKTSGPNAVSHSVLLSVTTH